MKKKTVNETVFCERYHRCKP